MGASERQHEIGRAWARALHRPTGSRRTWEAFDREEERAELERETRGNR